MPENIPPAGDGGGSAPPPEPAPAAGNQSDEQVAQGYFDDWSAKIEERLGHLEQGLAHIAQSQKVGASNAGSSSPEPSGAAGAGSPQGQQQTPTPASNSPTGQPGGAAPTGGEKPPKSGHIYFRSLSDLFGR